MKKKILCQHGYCNRSSVIILSALLFFLLEGCCTSWCVLTAANDTNETCQSYCDRMQRWANGTPTAGDSARRGLKPSGEYFAPILTAGPALNFKSSNEEYGAGYGKHSPGIGFHVGLGTVLPFNQHWAIAPSVRFIQKNASEKLGYSTPGGGSMEFKDNYSYNYVGATLLAQYRAGKNLSFAAGPEVNYLIGASVKNGGSGGTGKKESITGSSNKLGIDLRAGIKYEIPGKGNQRSKWGLSLFYDHRLSRLNKKEDMGIAVPAYKMKSVQLGLNYFWCVKCGK